jgi:hypothetical protein
MKMVLAVLDPSLFPRCPRSWKTPAWPLAFAMLIKSASWLKSQSLGASRSALLRNDSKVALFSGVGAINLVNEQIKKQYWTTEENAW